MELENLNGFGDSGSADVAEITKAVNAGQLTGQELNGQLTSGASLKVESLDNTLKVLTNKSEDTVVWKMIPKDKAYSNVEAYNRLVSYGNDGAAFTNEGELPESVDSQYERNAVLVKYLGTTREVTHPMTLVRTQVANLVQKETENGILWLMRQIDRGLAFADSKIVSQEFDGLYAMHRNSFTSLTDYHDSEVVIDLRGKVLKDADLESAVQGVYNNFGYASHIISSTPVFSNYVKNFHESKRVNVGMPMTAITGATMGQKVNQIQTQYGSVDIVADRFWQSAPSKKSTNLASHTKAPAAPVADGSTPIAVATATTKFTDSDGDYRYAVAAVNRYGESVLTMLGGVQAVAATEVVNLKFTAGAGTYAATGFVIYRTKVDKTSATDALNVFYPIFKVSAAELTAGYDGGAAGIVRDINRYIAGTEQALVPQFDTDVLAWKQLAPIMRMELATLSPSIRFMVLAYGTPVLFAPKKMARIINIGDDFTV